MELMIASGITDSDVCSELAVFFHRMAGFVECHKQTQIDGLARFGAELGESVKRSAEWQRQESPRFNIFEALGIERKEVCISKVLAYFLNPSADHGQGDVFLSEIIDVLNRALRSQNLPHIELPISGSRASVKTESCKLLKNGSLLRLDIVIEFGRSLLLVIENKVDALERDDQLEDYKTWMAGEPHARNELIFLTPDGRSPDSIEKVGECILLSYRDDISHAFRNAIPQIKSQSVSHAVAQFLQTISRY